MELNDDMKKMLTNLGQALHQALTKDPKIKDITDQIKDSGYDIYLIMEANIALDPREKKEDGRLFLHGPEEQIEMENIQFNDYDEKFLSGMKIQADSAP